MNPIFFGLLVVLIAIVALLLIGAVLLQSGKGDGLSGMGASGTQQILGARQAPDFIQKATWVLGSLLLLLSLVSSFATGTRGERAPIAAPTSAPAPGTPMAPGTNAPASPVTTPVNPATPVQGPPPTPAPAAPQR